MTPEQEHEYREEAERLKALDKATQRQIIEGQQRIADNPNVPTADRQYAAERAAALARLLRVKLLKNPKERL